MSHGTALVASKMTPAPVVVKVALGKETVSQLERNISSLYKTAQLEIQRKDKMIRQLRSK